MTGLCLPEKACVRVRPQPGPLTPVRSAGNSGLLAFRVAEGPPIVGKSNGLHRRIAHVVIGHASHGLP